MKCIWIENRISIETDGYTRPCCLETDSNARIDRIENGIINNFNHPILRELKENLKQGFNEKTSPFCHRCEALEKNNHPSLRSESGNPTEVRQLNFIQIKLSNQCQLACAHCGSDRSSTWAKINGESPHVKKSFEVSEKFINELIEILPQIKTLKFSGGEPFLQPDHWKILEKLKFVDKSHCDLQYITNGISPIRPDLWKGWKSVNCSISVDGFENTYEWFRRGSNWEKLLNNIKIIEQYSSIGINYAITPYTVSDYFRAKNFWEKKYFFSSFPIVYPYHCSMLKFPKKYIEMLDNYQEIPFSSSCSDNSEINLFREWAINSDKMWDTLGQANKLFWWM